MSQVYQTQSIQPVLLMLPHYNRPGHSEIVVGPNYFLNTLKVLVNMSKCGCCIVAKSRKTESHPFLLQICWCKDKHCLINSFSGQNTIHLSGKQYKLRHHHAL